MDGWSEYTARLAAREPRPARRWRFWRPAPPSPELVELLWRRYAPTEEDFDEAARLLALMFEADARER